MNYGLHGRYKVQVIDARTKRVKRGDRRWNSNLIMNNGMNKIASALLCDCFTYAIAGTGTTTGDRVSTSYGTTANCTVGGVVSLVGGTMLFNLVPPTWDMGNIIKWESTGYEARISGSLTATSCTVTPLPGSPQSGNFTIYRTNFNTLAHEVKRTNSYLPVSPYCGTTLIGNMLVHQRTWDFTAEVGTVAYTEMGVGWNGTLNDGTDPLGGSVFARFLLHGVTTVNAGEQLRLIYQLRVVLDPYADTLKTASITNWVSTFGSERIQYLGMSSVSSTGATANYDAAYYCNEPSRLTNVNAWLSTNSTVNAAFGTCVNRHAGMPSNGYSVLTSPTYTLHSYTKIKECTFGAGQGNSALIRSMGLGWNSGSNNPAQLNTICFVFSFAQTKDTSHSLNMQWFHTWSRVLGASSV